MKRIDMNKKKKRESLLDSAFSLFINNGFHKTSISDIVEAAGVAKGTFYLYFKDKSDIRNHLISHKASLVFHNAYRSLTDSGITDFEEQVIFFIDHILNQFSEDRQLVLLLSKHLSWGMFKNFLSAAELKDSENILGIFHNLLSKAAYTYRNPEVMIYMIVELVSGTSYNSILYGQPLPLEQLKPYIYDTVRNIMKNERVKPAH